MLCTEVDMARLKWLNEYYFSPAVCNVWLCIEFWDNNTHCHISQIEKKEFWNLDC